MRKMLLTYQVFGLVVFFIAFAASFFLADFLQEQSRDLINRSLVTLVDKSIKTTEDAVNSPKSSKLFSEQQLSLAKDEIARYKINPLKYVSNLTRDSETTKKPALTLDLGSILKQRLQDKAFAWKKDIKEKFNRLMGEVLSDARVFILSNLFVFIAALFFNLKAGVGNTLNYLASSVTSLPVVITILGFVDRNLLFAFLQNDVGRWTYTLGLAATYGWLFYEYFRRKSAA